MKKVFIYIYLILLMFVPSSFAQIYTATHIISADCSVESSGKSHTLCYDTSLEEIFQCVPNGSGDTTCDTSAEWVNTNQENFSTSQELANILIDETGSSGPPPLGTLQAVFNVDPVIYNSNVDGGPAIVGKVNRASSSLGGILIHDDDCTGETGYWWYDDSDKRFEFCEFGNPLDPLPITFKDFALRPTSYSSTDNAVVRWDGTNGDFLQDSGVIIDDSGNITANNLSGTNTGDQDLSTYVTGPASATDNAIVRYDGTTGKLIQDSSGITIDNQDNMTIAGSLDIAGTLTVGTLTTAIPNSRFRVGVQDVNKKGLVVQMPAGSNETAFEIQGPTGLPKAKFNTTGNGALVLNYSGTMATATYPGYVLSVQNIGDSGEGSWIEILNSGGANQGAFLGMYGDQFQQFNWQGGDIEFYTFPTVSNGLLRMTIKDTGFIGIGTSNPQGILDLNSSSSALRVTRLSDPSANVTTPRNGMIAYDSTDDELQAYIGGSWVDIGGAGSGTGDVTGPASSTDNAIARYDGTTGKIIQNSGATIDDSGNLTANNISGTNTGDQDLSTYVVGPASSTDNSVTRYDSTTGKLVQNSGVALDDNNDITGDGNMRLIGGSAANSTITLTGNTTTGNTSTNDNITMKVGDSAGTTALTIRNDGKTGLGTLTSGQYTERLNVDGSIRFKSRAAATTSTYLWTGSTRLWTDLSAATFLAGAGNTSASGGTNNIGIGPSALAALTSGSYNLAISFGAGANITEATNNFNMGVQNMFYNTIGNDNVAIGHFIQGFATGATDISRNTLLGAFVNEFAAGGNDNTLIGAYNSVNLEGTSNIIIGAYDIFGVGLSAGASNIGIGNVIFEGVASVDDVISIGNSSASNPGNDSIYIGNSVTGSATANELNIGNVIYGTGMYGTGKIRIGAATPTARLHLPAGTTSASSAPLKLTSGSLMTAPEAGAIEYLTDGLYYTQTTGPTRQQIASLAGSETFTNKTLTTPIITGKVDRNNVAVDDDDCTSEQGNYWYDTTDSQFEFCNANSGTPTAISSGTGDVVGPASSTDNAIVRFDGTTGKLVQNSGTTIDDNNNLLLVNNVAGETKGFVYKNSVPFVHTYYGGTSTGSNLFIGDDAGNQTMTSTGTLGSFMIGIGEDSLKSVTTADSTVCIGYKSCAALTTGDSNVAVGHYSLNKLDSTDNNVAVGFEAGKNIGQGDNVFIGYQAGKGGTPTGTLTSQSVIIGSGAGAAVTGTSQNTIIGYIAGNAVTSGDDNIFLGVSAGSGTTTGSGNILIGLGSTTTSASASDQLNIGNLIYGDLTGSERMGVNVLPTSISAQLHINNGSTTAGTAPLKFETGSRMTAAEEGAFEYERPYLYFTNGASAIRQSVDLLSERTLTDSATVSIDSSQGSVFLLTAGGDRTLLTPSNASAGKRILIAHTASGANRTLTLTTGSAGAFRFGTTITGLTATTSGTTDYIEAVYNSGANRWDVISYVKGF